MQGGTPPQRASTQDSRLGLTRREGPPLPGGGTGCPETKERAGWGGLGQEARADRTVLSLPAVWAGAPHRRPRRNTLCVQEYSLCPWVPLWGRGRQVGRVCGGSPKQLTSQVDEEIKYSAGWRGGF